jgi:hypothetical protein
MRSYYAKYEAKRGSDPVLLQKRRDKNNRYRLRHREFVLSLQARYRKDRLVPMRQKARLYREHLSSRVKTLLGGACACCGESRFEMLTLDHINNDGGGAKRPHHATTYYRVKKELESGDENRVSAVKKSFQLMCWNCNLSKRNGGECYHKRGPQGDEGKSRTLVYMLEYGRQVKRFLGGQCVCCGEKVMEFLALDHIYNDGHLEPRNKNGTRNVYKSYIDIIRAFKLNNETEIKRIRSRFQILCHNCNQSKKILGRCSHQSA